MSQLTDKINEKELDKWWNGLKYHTKLILKIYVDENNIV